MFEPKVDARALDRVRARFAGAGAKADQEIKRTMATVQRATQTAARRAIQSRYNLKARRIADDLFTFGQSARVGPRLGRGQGFEIGGTGFTLVGRKQPISFGSYGATAGAGGVRVAIRRGRVSLISGGFAAAAPGATSNTRANVQRRERYAGEIARAYGRPVRGPNVLFWVRTGAPKRRMTKGSNEGRLKEPIRPLFGPSIADALANADVRGEIDQFFIGRFNNEVARRLSRILARRGA